MSTFHNSSEKPEGQLSAGSGYPTITIYGYKSTEDREKGVSDREMHGIYSNCRDFLNATNHPYGTYKALLYVTEAGALPDLQGAFQHLGGIVHYPQNPHDSTESGRVLYFDEQGVEIEDAW